MLVAPGLEVIQAAGGMHAFMGWDKPMLTDSGGFKFLVCPKIGKFVPLMRKGLILNIPQRENSSI